MAIFNSYVSLPEGKCFFPHHIFGESHGMGYVSNEIQPPRWGGSPRISEALEVLDEVEQIAEDMDEVGRFSMGIHRSG